MDLEIVSYEDALADDAVRVFNRETESLAFVARLTPQIFREQIAAKRLFEPQGCFLAMEQDRAVGLALTCGVNPGELRPQNNEASIDGLFFPLARSDVGHALIDRCMDHLRSQGARTICGFASRGRYPFWRGLYAGTEPVCMTDYLQGWAELVAHGFVHHQQSVNYLGEPHALPYRKNFTYAIEDGDLSNPWVKESWRGHRPQALTAKLDDQDIARVGFAHMPFLSAYRNRASYGIYSFGVDRALRGQGIGSSLLAKLWEVIGDLGGQEVLVGTTIENAPARRAYQKAGMRLVAMRSGTVWSAPDVRA